MNLLKNLQPIKVIILFLLFLFASTGNVSAQYLDPGTGSFLIQILAAGALGGLFALKTFWRQINDFRRRIFSKNTNKQTAVMKRKNAKK